MKANFSKIVITPKINTPLAGYIDRDSLSKGVLDDLFCYVCLLEDDHESIVLVSVDSLAVDSYMTKEIRKKVSKSTNIKKENIIISASHTHSSSEYFFIGDRIKADKFLDNLDSTSDYYIIYNELIERISNEIIRISKSKKEVEIEYSVDYTNKIGSNRIDKKYYFEDSILNLSIKYNGQMFGIITFMACHPTVLNEKNLYFSNDFISKYREKIEERENCYCLFFQLTSADVSTRYTRTNSSYEECERFGEILYKITTKAIKKSNGKIDKLKLISTSIILNVKKFVPENEVLARIHKYKEASKLSRLEYVNYQGLQTLLEQISETDFKKANIEVTLIKLGEIILITLPFEVFSEYSETIREKLNNQNIFIVSCCNGYYGYLLDPNSYDNLVGYEKDVSLFDKEAGMKVIDTIKNVISQTNS